MEFAIESLETPALTKAQLAELLFEQIGLNKRESKDMIDAFFDLISASLVEGTDVKISGFGNFQIRTKAPRPGRNPRTGRSHPDPGASGGHLPRQPQAQGADPGRGPQPTVPHVWCADLAYFSANYVHASGPKQALHLSEDLRVTSKLFRLQL
jgi:integration host factor subunit alpha